MTKPDLEMRMFDLLADRATEGIGETETQELERLLGVFPSQNADEFDRTAALINIAMMGSSNAPLPSRVRDRLMIDAGKYFGTRKQDSSASSSLNHSEQVPVLVLRSQRTRAPWFLAAATLAFAVLGWWQVYSPDETSQPLRLRYDEFSGSPDIVRVSWVGTENPYKKVSGEALWSDSTQAGYMRFVGLEPNDPQRFQYQLWIVDPDRDKHPVDGGVFDVANAGEMIIPMEAKLRVERPKAFAITLEKSGGVVVSGGPLVLVGSVSG